MTIVVIAGFIWHKCVKPITRESSEEATFIRNGQHLVWPLGLLVFNKADIADSIAILTRLCETQLLCKITFCSEASFE